MYATIERPTAGQPMRASWAAGIADRVNELCCSAPAGMLVREGVGGTGCEPLPANKRRAPGELKPWTFHCHEDDEGNRTGGWLNCRMQIGYDASIDETDGAHTDLCEDGVYYAEVDLTKKEWDLKCVADATGKGEIPASDFENNKVNVYIGTVEDGECTYSIHCIPVVYMYV